MISERHGNLLEAETDALVNTVNTVGVMGKGVALQFKRAYPANFKAYKRACDLGQVELGRMFVWDAGELDGRKPRFVINFPTKQHWKSRSRLSDIKAGLEDLIRVIDERSIRTIALPPLGCGHGGLRWSDVKPLILEAFAGRPDVEVILFPPEGAPAPRTQPVRTDNPNMTPGRAALINIMARYLPVAFEVTPLDIQKLMYFMQEAGEPLRLNYVRDQYGPYADNLRHVLSSMEGHYIRGVGDGSARALDAIPFELLPGALDEAQGVLENRTETPVRIDRVIKVIEGFESTYGLELLATVHWAATRGANSKRLEFPIDDESIERTVRSWNERKGKIFTPRHIATATSHLRSLNWLDIRQPVGLFAVGE